jgi:hypothetical protein
MTNVTRDDIRKIAVHNAVVYAALQLHRREELSFEESMMFAVSVLVEQVQNLKAELQKAYIESPNYSWKID